MTIHNFYQGPNELRNIVQNATLMGFHKKEYFIKYLMKQNSQFPSRPARRAKAIKDLVETLEIFKAHYGDRVDLHWYYTGTYFRPLIKVLYPEFNITNSRGESHKIKDLLVIHPLYFNGEGDLTITRPKGGRLSKTYKEVVSNYQQSHLPGHESWTSKPFEVSEFCIGGDTDVSLMVSEFAAGIEMERLELYLFCIDSMVVWESLEGVPYRYINSIHNSDSLKVYSYNSVQANKLVRKIISDKIPLDVDFYVKENRYRIATNKKASDFVKKLVLESISPTNYNTILVTPSPTNATEYLGMEKESVMKSLSIASPEEYIIFNGRKIFPRIIKEEQKKKKSIPMEDYIIYPKFLEHVCRELEYKIYEKAVANSAARLFGATRDDSRSVTSDTVSL